MHTFGNKSDEFLYIFCGDDPIGKFDALGLKWITGTTNPGQIDTIECDGKGGIRVFLTEETKRRGIQCSVALDCRIKHEESHAADALASNPNVCKGKAAGIEVLVKSVSNEELNKSERIAYDIEIKCIRDSGDKFAQCGCSKPLEEYVADLLRNRKKYETPRKKLR